MSLIGLLCFCFFVCFFKKPSKVYFANVCVLCFVLEWQVAELPGRAPPWPGLEPLYVITPTYRRPEQVAELTRMAQTLLLVRNVHWLVVEDAKAPSAPVAALLRDSGLRCEHLTGGWWVR